MKDIIISVDSTSHKVNFPDEFLGIGYENLQGNLIFQFDNNFIGGQARLDISIDCESGMIPNLTPYENGYILPIKSSLLTGKNVLMQLVIDETSLTQYSLTTDTEINPNKTYYEKVGNDYIIVENPVVGDLSQYYEANTPVFKTDIFQLKVKDSINAQETIPEQYPTWINTLNTLIGTINQKLGLVDTALTEMNNLNINVSDKVDGEVTITFTDKQGNQKEVKINDGRGIISILKTSTNGNIDTYTITYTDDTTSTFEVTNGIDGTDGRGIVSIEKTGTTGLIDTYTITYTDNTTSTFNVANGKGITNIEKISTNLLVDTYRISFNDGTSQNYEVTNGKGIVSIQKTSTEGLTDIYTITYNDETTATFNVVNGKGIVSIEKTSTSGYVDTYTITYNDGTTSTYEVTNGEVSQAQLDALQDELNYYKTIVNALPKITGSGTSITLNNTADSILSNVLNPSELSQDGTPTPETPYDIHTISGDNTIVVNGKNWANTLTTIQSLPSDTTSSPTTPRKFTRGTYIVGMASNNYYVPNSVTITNHDKDKWTISNTLAGFGVGFPLNLPLGTYKQVRGTGSQGLLAVLKYDSEGNYISNTTGSTFNIEEGFSYMLVIVSTIANSQITFSETMLLKLAETDITYEPYQEQTAQVSLGDIEYSKMPNTDYSDEFIRTSGENLFDKDNATFRNGYYKNDNGVENTSSSGSGYTTSYVSVKPNTQYTISGTFANTSMANYGIYYYDNNKTWISRVTTTSNPPFTFTTPNNCYYIQFQYYSSVINKDTIMLNEGDTALPYEPYGSNEWYLKKNIGKADVNNVVISYNSSYGFYLLNISNAGGNAIIYTPTISSHFANSGTTATRIVGSNGNNLWLWDTENYFENAEEIKQFLIDNNVAIYYVLATPTYILLNDTLQSQLEYIYNQMLAYKSQTNISQTNNDLPFIIDSTALKDLTSL